MRVRVRLTSIFALYAEGTAANERENLLILIYEEKALIMSE
jgi:hypothetical protein